MIRNIFVTLLFFFGPALLMFVLRNMFFMWKARQQRKKAHPDVIDISPTTSNAPSPFFIASAISVGIVFAYLVWAQLSQNTQEQGGEYIPAHINEFGELVHGKRLLHQPPTLPNKP